MSPDLTDYVRCWNEGRFFDAHETLEPRWIKQRDAGLQGLIQLAAALHHLQRGNLRGAKTMLGRAVPRLLDRRNAPCELDQRSLADYGSRLLDQIGSAPERELLAARPRL